MHRWSGWPGAWCLDCGVPDPSEEALGHGCDDIVCIRCGTSYPQETDPCTTALTFDVNSASSLFYLHEIKFQNCGQHGSMECPEPMSYNHDPYHTEKNNARISESS